MKMKALFLGSLLRPRYVPGLVAGLGHPCAPPVSFGPTVAALLARPRRLSTRLMAVPHLTVRSFHTIVSLATSVANFKPGPSRADQGQHQIRGMPPAADESSNNDTQVQEWSLQHFS
jgi:hypothetical protein